MSDPVEPKGLLPDPTHLARALLDPADVYASPEDVLIDATLTRDQKVEVLRRWAYGAEEVQQAESEGMPVVSGALLDQILAMLHRLGVDPAADKA